MPVQLGSDVPLLIPPVVPQDLDVVMKGVQWYVESGLRARATYDPLNRIVLALLSVNSPFEATVKCWYALEGVDWTDHWAVLSTLKNTHARDGVVSYAWTKARWIRELMHMAKSEGVSYHSFQRDVDYRDYLQLNTLGLGMAKASYAVMLVNGLADVCCVDTHMYRLFTGKVATKSIPKRTYLQMEQSIRELALRHGVPTSATQHCVWDAMRGVRTELVP